MPKKKELPASSDVSGQDMPRATEAPWNHKVMDYIAEVFVEESAQDLKYR